MIEPRLTLQFLASLLLAVTLPVAIAQDAVNGTAPPAGGATLGRMGEPAVVDPETFEFSEAESRLWMSDHLENISRPARLHYRFTKAGSLEEGFSDDVFLDVVELNADGTKNTNIQFFTGEREQPFTPDNVTSVRGNPVLGMYMRGDVLDMNRLTEGDWRYFQRRIKVAFSEGAVIEPVTITYAGKQLPAQRISISPYVKDVHRAQFDQFGDKRYEFLMSEEIPGMLYQIHTIVPGASDKDKPLLEETLTLQGVEFRS